MKKIKLVAKKIEQRAHCWACGESLAMAGLRYCPQCGAYNEIEFKEVMVRPAEYRLIVVRYAVGAQVYREEFRDTSVEEVVATLPEGATLEQVIPLWQTAPERHADYKDGGEWYDAGYECSACGCRDSWPGAFPECMRCGNI
jgi:predicted RNA-binding Zn-ribbon protein involved in translation (DUF1610 family)